MKRPLGDVCLDIASFARERKHEFLSYILRLAAAEAFKTSAADEHFEMPVPRRLAAQQLIIGIWDWDISNDRNYLDAGAASFFDIDIDSAARGLPNRRYLDVIHPDDIGRVEFAIAASMQFGGRYECEFRIVRNDHINWVLARGHCTLDRNGRAVRLPGVLVDITRDKAMH